MWAPLASSLMPTPPRPGPGSRGPAPAPLYQGPSVAAERSSGEWGGMEEAAPAPSIMNVTGPNGTLPLVLAVPGRFAASLGRAVPHDPELSVSAREGVRHAACSQANGPMLNPVR